MSNCLVCVCVVWCVCVLSNFLECTPGTYDTVQYGMIPSATLGLTVQYYVLYGGNIF